MVHQPPDYGEAVPSTPSAPLPINVFLSRGSPTELTTVSLPRSRQCLYQTPNDVWYGWREAYEVYVDTVLGM